MRKLGQAVILSKEICLMGCLRKRVLPFFFIFSFILSLLPVVPVEAKLKDTTWLGDSRFVGLSGVAKENFVAEISKGYNWGIEQEITTKTIIFGLGVNDLYNSGKYKSWLKKLVKDHTVYFVSVNPVNEKKCKTVKNKTIKAFNKKMKKVDGINYIDTYTYLQNNGFNSSDGLHYDNKTNKKIYKYILGKVDTDESKPSSTSKPSDSKGTASDVEVSDTFKKLLKKYLGKEPNKQVIYNWSLAISSLRTDGFNDNGIAGVLGNIKVEGGASSEFCIEGYWGEDKKTKDGKTYSQFKLGSTYDYGNVEPHWYTSPSSGKVMGGEGHGLAQWSFGRASALTKFAKNHPDYGYVTVKHKHKSYDSSVQVGTFSMPSLGGQVCFMIKELNSEGYKACKNAVKDASSPEAAAKDFHDMYEKSGTGNVSDRQKAAKEALDLVKECTAVYGDGSTSGATSGGTKKSTASKLATDLAMDNIWSESQLSAFNKLTEDDIMSDYLANATKDKLGVNELESMENWKTNVDSLSKDSTLSSIARRIVMLVGILLCVWSVLLYIAYWFDRINNFIDFNFLGVVSFGRLRISDTESECTWGNKDVNGIRTVNHRVILTICIISIAFAVFIISGKIFQVVGWIVRLVSGII